MTDSGGIARVAITTNLFVDEKGVKRNHFLKISEPTTIDELLTAAFKAWNLQVDNLEDYGLKSDTTGKYITDSDGGVILKNGDILKLWYSPTRVARKCLADLDTATTDRKSICYGERMEKASSLYDNVTADAAILPPMLQLDGVKIAVNFLETQTDDFKCEKNCYSVKSVLGSLVTLLSFNDDALSVEPVQKSLLSEVIRVLETQLPLETAGKTVTHCLEITAIMAEWAVKNDPEFDVETILPSTMLLSLIHAYSNHTLIHRQVIATFNRFYAVSTENVRRTLRKMYYKHRTSTFIKDNLIMKTMNQTLKEEMLKLQVFLIQALLDQFHKKLDPQDHRALELIKELRKRAFAKRDGGGNEQRGRFSDDYRMLGFATYTDPSKDFQSSTSGKLALNLMTYFAVKYTDDYTTFVEESSSCGGEASDCPFGACSIAVVELLCQILCNKTDASNPESYMPCFFGSEDFLGVSFFLIIFMI